MTHKEFKLIVKKEITENSGRNIFPIIFKIGDTFIVDDPSFNSLQSNDTITRYTGEGICEFDKYNFENEVSYTEITITYGTRKLGQRKKFKQS